ncbi:MAG: esterase family protein [Gemmatimonadota bacterium]|nr:esterase family protein [Gemmatimonadota bacterium]
MFKPALASLSIGVLFVAVVSWSPVLSGTLTVETVRSEAIADNLLGDSGDIEVAVYTPPGYPDGVGRYPTLYLLHGIMGSFRDWTGGGYQGLQIQTLMDSLITAGAMPPTIVVMPTAANRYGGSYYVDSPVTGGWGQFMGRELVAWVDANYETVPDRGARAIAGHSMGGFGSIMAAVDYPDVFSVVYAMSPCCLALVEDFGAGNLAWTRTLAFDDEQDVPTALQAGDFYPVAMMGFMSVASPDASRPPFFVDPPFAPDGRGFVLEAEPAFTEFRSYFPTARLDELAGPLRRLDGLAIDTGHNDQFAHIPPGAATLSAGLTERNVPHVFEVYDGDHRNRMRERMTMIILPFIARYLEN